MKPTDVTCDVELLQTLQKTAKTPWNRVLLSRDPARPRSLEYIHAIVDDFVELSGDRLYADDPSIVGGFGCIAATKCMIVAQEKGNDTETRLQRNFGMVNPEGFRKALRLFRLAEKFSLPIISFVDTPGAYAGLEAEERGQGWAIAENLRVMSALKTSILVIIIGEGCSGGALAVAVGDRVAALENSYYSVISPEGCASILWKDTQKKEEAAQALRLTPEDLLEQGIIDDILMEPMGGAHTDPSAMFATVKSYITTIIPQLQSQEVGELLEKRYARYRAIGRFCEAG